VKLAPVAAGLGLTLLGATMLAGLLTAAAAGTSAASPATLQGALAENAPVPEPFKPWITRAAALCAQESPALIAAQLWTESRFDVRAVSPAGAVGPAQFLPTTFAAWGHDDDANGTTSPTDIGDAVMAQGRLMCSLLNTAAASGYPGGTVALALAGYNAGWQTVAQNHGLPPYPETMTYIQRVTTQAAAWTAPPPASDASTPTTTGTGQDAVQRAQAWLGTPYVYGGGTPTGPSSGFCDGTRGMLAGTCYAATHSGFDCSSLVQLAWWPTIHLPRVAASQYQATATHTVPLTDLQPGDLLFYDHGTGIDHVAIYAGSNRMIQAPSTGKTVEIVPFQAGQLVAATRPA
jgi:cell wall-associated NlpC family hydrolase